MVPVYVPYMFCLRSIYVQLDFSCHWHCSRFWKGQPTCSMLPVIVLIKESCLLKVSIALDAFEWPDFLVQINCFNPSVSSSLTQYIYSARYCIVQNGGRKGGWADQPTCVFASTSTLAATSSPCCWQYAAKVKTICCTLWQCATDNQSCGHQLPTASLTALFDNNKHLNISIWKHLINEVPYIQNC